MSGAYTSTPLFALMVWKRANLSLPFTFTFTFTLDAGLLARSQYSKVLRPATSTQVFLGFPVPKSKC